MRTHFRSERLMDEAGCTRPAVPRRGIGQRRYPAEISVRSGQCLELLIIEQIAEIVFLVLQITSLHTVFVGFSSFYQSTVGTVVSVI